MKKIIQYSKSYKNIADIKKDFYNQNLYNLKKSIKINTEYVKQPLRKICKNCNSKKLVFFLKSFKVSYNLCSNCGHLNGKYQDTSKFARKLYNSQNGKNYSKNYLNDYNSRVKNIYLPKVVFLKKVIKENIKLLDLGSGAGHFLKALEIKKISATGYETSKDLCNLANKKLKVNKINNIKFDNVYNLIEKAKDENVLSLIGVLEHLTNPSLILNSFAKSKIKYLYISVPLFSLTSFIENSFKNVYPRHLSGAHTHLYTYKSLKYLAKNNNLNIIGEFWFGTDIPDLMRSILNSATIINKKQYLTQFKNLFTNHIDELQSVLDKKKICSEVHMIFKKK